MFQSLEMMQGSVCLFASNYYILIKFGGLKFDFEPQHFIVTCFAGQPVTPAFACLFWPLAREWTSQNTSRFLTANVCASECRVLHH
jgi:hypothetical protein